MALSSCSEKLDFCATFYYVCYDGPSDAHSAASLSSTVQSYGGAGYTVKCGDDYFVTVACYYTENDARTVCSSLNKRGLECFVKKVERSDYPLKGNARKNKDLYLGNLNTLCSMSEICYSLANSLETGERDREGAKKVLGDVEVGLESLIRQNPSNCFSGELNSLKAECRDTGSDYILARDVRRLQICLTDAVINIKLY